MKTAILFPFFPQILNLSFGFAIYLKINHHLELWKLCLFCMINITLWQSIASFESHRYHHWLSWFHVNLQICWWQIGTKLMTNWLKIIGIRLTIVNYYLLLLVMLSQDDIIIQSKNQFLRMIIFILYLEKMDHIGSMFSLCNSYSLSFNFLSLYLTTWNVMNNEYNFNLCCYGIKL